MAAPIVTTTHYIRDLSDYRDATFTTSDNREIGLAHGMALQIDGVDWYVVRCPYCRAAYGARISVAGYVGSSADFCQHCDKMLPG